VKSLPDLIGLTAISAWGLPIAAYALIRDSDFYGWWERLTASARRVPGWVSNRRTQVSLGSARKRSWPTAVGNLAAQVAEYCAAYRLTFAMTRLPTEPHGSLSTAPSTGRAKQPTSSCSSASAAASAADTDSDSARLTAHRLTYPERRRCFAPEWFRGSGDIPGVSYMTPEQIDRTSLPGYDEIPAMTSRFRPNVEER
jgi:hypothetical protein